MDQNSDTGRCWWVGLIGVFKKTTALIIMYKWKRQAARCKDKVDLFGRGARSSLLFQGFKGTQWHILKQAECWMRSLQLSMLVHMDRMTTSRKKYHGQRTIKARKGKTSANAMQDWDCPRKLPGNCTVASVSQKYNVQYMFMSPQLRVFLWSWFTQSEALSPDNRFLLSRVIIDPTAPKTGSPFFLDAVSDPPRPSSTSSYRSHQNASEVDTRRIIWTRSCSFIRSRSWPKLYDLCGIWSWLYDPLTPHKSLVCLSKKHQGSSSVCSVQKSKLPKAVLDSLLSKAPIVEGGSLEHFDTMESHLQPMQRFSSVLVKPALFTNAAAWTAILGLTLC